MVPLTHDAPLAGCRVVECAGTPAAAYAARMLATMGACVTMLEPPGQGSPLRQLPPRLDGGRGESALFAYLAAGKRSVACDLASPSGQAVLARELAQTDILIEDTPLADRAARGLAPDDDACRALLLDLVCVDMGGPPCRGDARYHQTLRELVARAKTEFRATN